MTFLSSYVSEIVLYYVKEEMYNTMNSYYKYTSIPQSSANKINILILPITTGKKYLKYSIHFTYICDYPVSVTYGRNSMSDLASGYDVAINGVNGRIGNTKLGANVNAAPQWKLA